MPLAIPSLNGPVFFRIGHAAGIPVGSALARDSLIDGSIAHKRASYKREGQKRYFFCKRGGYAPAREYYQKNSGNPERSFLYEYRKRTMNP